jgi:signal transduction histidine kinase
VEFECRCTQNPPPEIKEMVYRIVQEAFNNISKHAEANKVTVRLVSQESCIELVIQDDGIGFDPGTARTEGLGLEIMAERARTVGAGLEIRSQFGKGTKLQLLWPNSD